MSSEEKVILAIRVRGQVSVRPQIEDTLKKLRLGRLHQARIFKVTPSIQGMITKSKDYITWGEVELQMVEKLIAKYYAEIVSTIETGTIVIHRTSLNSHVQTIGSM